MIAMGKALDLKIVAEGVETPEQAMRLRELGCDHAQGYLFARPQPPEELVEYGRQVLTASGPADCRPTAHPGFPAGDAVRSSASR